MTCQLCNQPGEYRERFKMVLCLTHYLEALLGFLNSQPKALVRVPVDESQTIYRSSWDAHTDSHRFNPKTYGRVFGKRRLP